MERIALRINEAVIVSGLSRSTLYSLISKNRLRAIKAGGRRLILVADLQAYFSGLQADA